MQNNKQQNKNTIYTRNLDPIEAGFRISNITLFDKDEEEIDLLNIKQLKLCVSIPTFNNHFFTNEIGKLDILLNDFENITSFLISNEPVFTQTRLNRQLHLGNFQIISDFKNREYARATGTYIYELGSLVKSVFLIDRSGKVLFSKYYDDLYSNIDLNEISEELKKALDD